MAAVSELKGQQILNSRGIPTVEVELKLVSGEKFTASCPSGISRGTREAIELRDKDFNRFQGLEVKNAVKKINSAIVPIIKGKNPVEQDMIDRKLIELDGTPNKANLGVNSILPVSLAVAKAGAHVARKRLFTHLNDLYNLTKVSLQEMEIDSTNYEIKLPRPAMLMVEGGKHGTNKLAIQEFLFIPQFGKPRDFWESLRMASEVYHHIHKKLIQQKQACGYGEEGGLTPNIDSSYEVLDLIVKSAKEKNYAPDKNFTLGIDAAGAAPEEDALEFYSQMVHDYPLELLEDPFGEAQWETWTKLKESFQEKGLESKIIGDDLVVTNLKMIQKAVRGKTIHGIIIKPNQIGTVSEVLQVAKYARTTGLTRVVSHRGGETNDTFIADLAVAIGAEFIKTGAPNRGERIAKYNRLLDIDRMLVQNR